MYFHTNLIKNWAMDTWVSTRLLVEYAFWSFNFYVCIYFIFRILETSQRLLHLIAQPWNWSLTSLMLTATWHTAYRCSSAVILHLSIYFFLLLLLSKQIFWLLFVVVFAPHFFRLCVTGQIMMSGWKSLWALWQTNWRRTACPQCTHTTACCIRSLTASARPLLSATETFAWTR